MKQKFSRRKNCGTTRRRNVKKTKTRQRGGNSSLGLPHYYILGDPQVDEGGYPILPADLFEGSDIDNLEGYGNWRKYYDEKAAPYFREAQNLRDVFNQQPTTENALRLVSADYKGKILQKKANKYRALEREIAEKKGLVKRPLKLAPGDAYYSGSSSSTPFYMQNQAAQGLNFNLGGIDFSPRTPSVVAPGPPRTYMPMQNQAAQGLYIRPSVVAPGPPRTYMPMQNQAAQGLGVNLLANQREPLRLSIERQQHSDVSEQSDPEFHNELVDLHRRADLQHSDVSEQSDPKLQRELVNLHRRADEADIALKDALQRRKERKSMLSGQELINAAFDAMPMPVDPVHVYEAQPLPVAQGFVDYSNPFHPSNNPFLKWDWNKKGYVPKTLGSKSKKSRSKSKKSRSKTKKNRTRRKPKSQKKKKSERV